MSSEQTDHLGGKIYLCTDMNYWLKSTLWQHTCGMRAINACESVIVNIQLWLKIWLLLMDKGQKIKMASPACKIKTYEVPVP